MTRVKICGVTRVDDAVVADRHGAGAIGLIFAPSPRRISVEQANSIHRVLSPWISRVGVFVDASLSEIASVLAHVPLDVLQLHGEETPAFAAEARRRFGVRVVKAIRMRDASVLQALPHYDVDAFLLDTYVPGQPGGTGETFDWSLAAPLVERYRVILAGGLTPDTVSEAVQSVRPYGIDVSSGVEQEPGVKDHTKVMNFIARARQAALSHPAS